MCLSGICCRNNFDILSMQKTVTLGGMMKSISKVITVKGQEVSIESNVKEVWVSPFDFSLSPPYTFMDSIRPRGHIVCEQTFKIDGEIVTAEQVNKVLDNERQI